MLLRSLFPAAALCLSLFPCASRGNTVTYAVVQAAVSSKSDSDRPSGYHGQSHGPMDLSGIKGVYAAFGSVSSYSGRLMKAQPFTACGRVYVPRSLLRTRSLVLLVEHGGCNYTHKVRNLRLAGVSAMILKNREDELRQMESAVEWPGFVAVMVKKSMGLELARRLDEGRVVNVTISVGETQKEEYGLIDEKAFTVICVAFGLVIAFSMFGLSFFYIQRCRVLEAERRQQVRTTSIELTDCLSDTVHGSCVFKNKRNITKNKIPYYLMACR